MTDALFTPDQLNDTLPEQVSNEQATTAELIVWGWVSNVTGLDTRPDPVTPDLFAWALELGGIAVRNNVKRKQVGQVSYAYDDDMRRAEILAQLSSAGDVGEQKGGPQGCFPPAQCWPDPIRVGPIGPFSDAVRQQALDWWNS